MSEDPKNYQVGRIREALAADPRVNDLNIDITMSGNRIFLSGDVATAERHAAITRVVEELCPGYEVHNQTQVGLYPETTQVEQLG